MVSYRLMLCGGFALGLLLSYFPTVMPPVNGFAELPATLVS